MSAKFGRIVAIARMKYQYDQNNFATIVKRRADLVAMNNRLDESRYLSSGHSNDSVSQKQSFHWGRWIDATQATVNMEIFTLASEEDISRAELQKSYGRYLAINSISEKLQAQHQK
jgi:hypothetical protein